MNDERIKMPKRRRKKRRGWLSRLKWIVMLLCFLLLIGTVYWFVQQKTHDNGTKELVQGTADTPIYILATGIDQSEPQTADTIMLIAVNFQKQTAAAISLLPNMGSPTEDGHVPLLKDSYRAGGIVALKEQVERSFQIFIPYYVVVDESHFASWLDTRGPVSLYVEKNMEYDDGITTPIRLAQGYQELDGNQAIAYLRYRDSIADELGRVQRQQRFLKAYLSQLQKQYSWVNYMYTYFGWDHFTSNISAGDGAKLVYELTKIPPENVAFYIVPGELQTAGEVHYWQIEPIGSQTLIGKTLTTNMAK
ncbi:LCP family protein [Negativicoccus succinicivorans]|uniref:LCP family protein n=1 Tax=Negativicoccus succinicivorans TaxID=620903 RepID=UPI002904B835|nr:LCP family protein [Negativicoccus succinicivorans]MDU2417394.1 LCP family protein [Negativicoccus succinicivorans]